MLVSGTYVPFYEGISAFGEGPLKVSDIEYYKREDFEKKKNKNLCFEICDKVTSVEKGFFDMFLTLRQVIIPDSCKRIDMSDESVDLFRRNGVIIRGTFGSYAEQFAVKYGFEFMHSDVELYQAGDYFQQGVDIITLRFRPNYMPFIHEDCRCQGSSAGSIGGGETDFDLKPDFYKSMTVDEIADQCWGNVQNGVRNSKALRTFMKEARERKGFRIKAARLEDKKK